MTGSPRTLSAVSKKFINMQINGVLTRCVHAFRQSSPIPGTDFLNLHYCSSPAMIAGTTSSNLPQCYHH
ncbi:hypothetical protein ElyMa_002230200 [Elysia marginata]|uniref:Uncharacterized protein n=1 Tax=Elysia marginata TaxID=1093978 RepID=A0AAV4FXU6_9GAST|nr:hypothetical protein ElyMa_002230200 [Elysia marginata]